VDGLRVDGMGFELLAGGVRVGSRRVLSATDVELLTSLGDRYVRVVDARMGSGALLALGRELYAWLDGPEHQLAAVLARWGLPRV
jgi:hypothetical protein